MSNFVKPLPNYPSPLLERIEGDRRNDDLEQDFSECQSCLQLAYSSLSCAVSEDLNLSQFQRSCYAAKGWTYLDSANNYYYEIGLKYAQNEDITSEEISEDVAPLLEKFNLCKAVLSKCNDRYLLQANATEARKFFYANN